MINLIFKTLLIYLFLSFSAVSFGNEDTEPRSVAKQYRDWTYNCVKQSNKKNQCEIIQTLQIQNSNLKFNFVYSNFINQENELKDIFTIITPLGVNLQKSLKLKFHEGMDAKLPYSKCEVIGCIMTISNNTKDKTVLSIFNQIKDAMTKSIYFEIEIDGFKNKPLTLKSSLQGFKAALKELENSKS